MFIMKVLSNELGAIMLWIVNGRFAHHIMNTHGRPLSHLHDANSMSYVGRFATICIHNEKCECRIGNKESKNQPIGSKDKICFECGMVNLECCQPFTIHIHDRRANLNGCSNKRF